MILALLCAQAHATDLGGYFRVQARPDLVGGDARLGDSALYGRLLNEGPWALVHLRQDLVPKKGRDPWGDLHLRVEGGSLPGADGSNGALDAFRVSQFYVQGGNLGPKHVTFRVGTLETTFGDLWLFDARPTQLLTDVLGAQATWAPDDTEVVLAAGDAGWTMSGADHHAVPSVGGSVRRTLGEHVAVGLGGQAWRDDEVTGKVTGYVGVGKAGPLTWNRLQVVWQRRPDVAGGPATDAVFVGDELELAVLPERLDVALAAQVDHHADHTAVASVVRAQVAVTPTVAVLGETSAAREFTDGAPARDTWQGKVGVVLSPAGPSMSARPALRLLYGAQHASTGGAWPGAPDTARDRRWHHLVSLEAEAWF